MNPIIMEVAYVLDLSILQVLYIKIKSKKIEDGGKK